MSPPRPLVLDETVLPAEQDSPLLLKATDVSRLNGAFSANYRLVWRFLRRLGIEPQAVDDVAQKVFLVLAGKLEAVKVGSERSFLFGTAIRAASDARSAAAAREREVSTSSFAFDLMETSIAAPDALLERKRAREMLDAVLLDMGLELRVVFVAFEVEGLTMAEISQLLEIPAGTVASRLRRAREAFFSRVELLSNAEVRTATTGATNG